MDHAFSWERVAAVSEGHVRTSKVSRQASWKLEDLRFLLFKYKATSISSWKCTRLIYLIHSFVLEDRGSTMSNLSIIYFNTIIIISDQSWLTLLWLIIKWLILNYFFSQHFVCNFCHISWWKKFCVFSFQTDGDVMLWGHAVMPGCDIMVTAKKTTFCMFFLGF